MVLFAGSFLWWGKRVQTAIDHTDRKKNFSEYNHPEILGSGGGAVYWKGNQHIDRVDAKTDGLKKGAIKKDSMLENIVAENDIIYLTHRGDINDLSFDANIPKYYPTIVAIDTTVTDDNGEYKVKWKLKYCGVWWLSSYKDSIVGDRVYVSGYGVTCINKNTGEKI